VKSFWIKLVASLVIGAFFIWMAARGVNWDDLQRVFSQVDGMRLLGYLVILSAVQFVRILRWGILLKPLGRVGFGRLMSVGSVGIMALILLPLRLGEFARPILIARPGGIRVSAALATVVVERVVDSLAMALLLTSILFFLGDRLQVPFEIHTWAWAILVVFLLILVFLVVAHRRREKTIAWFRRWPLRLLPGRLSGRLESILRSFIDGLQALPNMRLAAVFLAMTVLYWGMAGAGLWYMFGAFEELGHLGLIEAFTVLSILCVGLMIPAGPGMIGNFHYFTKLGLSLFISKALLGTSGMAFAIIVHAMQLGQQVLWGVPFLFTAHISLRRIIAPTGSGQGAEQRSA